MNVKNHEIYSDKFVLHVLNIKTLEDDSIEKEPADLYYWAKLFKATTWEEIQMLASKNPDFEDTIVTMQELSEEGLTDLIPKAASDPSLRQELYKNIIFNKNTVRPLGRITFAFTVSTF